MNRRFLPLVAVVSALALLTMAVTPAFARSSSAPVQQVSQGTPYTVRAGDTWNIIANIFGVSADRLIDFNGLRTRPNLIFVGEVIRIPINMGFETSFVQPFFYIVQTGDTIASLASRFEIDETALLVANGLSTSGAGLTVGDTIIIPAGPHRVVTGAESVADVAARYETTVERLLVFNPHLSGATTTVVPGLNIFVPIQYNTALLAPTTTTAPAPTIGTGAAAPTSILPAASVGGRIADAISVEDGSTKYVVQLGDAWPRIERLFGVDAATLINLNDLRERPNLIFVGEVITIPIAIGSVPSFVNPFLYTAVAGDTIQALINTFEIDKSALLSANGLSASLDSNTPLTAGEALLIPAGPHRTTVQAGETLQDIADRYSTTTSNLLQFNSHLSETPLPGQNVFIPIQFNAPFVAAPGLSVGAGGDGAGATTATTSPATPIADPGGALDIRWVVLRSTRFDPAFGSETGKVIVTLAIEFRGGATPFTLLHEGVETTYTGPFVRDDNNTTYTDLDFDVAGITCGGSLVAAVELRSADGQTATHTYFVTVPCPTTG